MERKINPATGCYCDFVHMMTGDGCDICNPEYAEELRKEAELEGAKNTEQANQPDSGEQPSQVISTLFYCNDKTFGGNNRKRSYPAVFN